MEYTIISVIAMAVCLYYSLIVMKLHSKRLVLISGISIFFQLIFDNYMTSLGLWIFDFSKTLGITVPIIPLENLFFGLALTIATVVSWEIVTKKKA